MESTSGAGVGWLADNPDLLAQWHPTANGDLDPHSVRAGSGRRVWWRCPDGHEWQTMVANRTRKGSGCPTCSGRRAGPANNLAATHPDVAASWHPTANGDLTPATVKASSGQRAWWFCPLGHEWQTSVFNRVRCGCPSCTGHSAGAGTSLAATHPGVAAQWHPTANGDLTPEKVRAGSSRSIYWLCPDCGRAWTANPARRTRARSGCPWCSVAARRRTTRPLNETHPEVAAQWHPTANQLAHPAHITYGSGRIVWWQCEQGHSWQTSPHQRCCSRSGCPYCARQRPTPENNLAAVRPTVAALWHPTRNRDRHPERVSPWSNVPAWWQCPAGHEWERPPRAQRPACPQCRAGVSTADHQPAGTSL